MSVKITHGNSVFECSTPEEAVRMHALLQSSSQSINSSIRNGRNVLSNSPAGEEHYDDNAVRWTHQLLSALSAAGPAGLTTNAVMPLVDANGSKAMGGRMAVVNRLLSQLGFPKAYTNDKVEGVRIWKARKSIEEAISRLERVRSEA